MSHLAAEMNAGPPPASNEPEARYNSQSHPFGVDQPKVWMMMPAFNEEAGLPTLLTKLSRVGQDANLNYEIVVVDDASTDDTAQIVSKRSFDIPITLQQHTVNKGLAGAMRTGFEFVLQAGKPGDIIVTMDADDTQPPATIPKMLTMIEEGYDVVIASRYQPGSRTVGVPRHRLMMTWFAKWLFKLSLPIPKVWDYTCGFRAYRFESLKQVADVHGDNFVSEKGFSCMADVLLKMRPFNFVMGEVPMLLRYDQKGGLSKMNVQRTATQTCKLILKRRFGGTSKL